jgi:hypothetical protein
MFKKLFLIIFVIHLFSCKNDQPLTFTIKGTVKDTGLNKLLTTGNISIYSIPATSNIKKFEGTTTISSNGSYEITIDRDQYTSIEIHIDQEGYFNDIEYVKFSELNATEDNLINLTTTSKSWIRFNIRNIINPNNNDEFKFLKDFGKEKCNECCENGFTYFYGEVDTNIICINDGGSYFGYYFWVNGNQQFGNDSILTVPFDTIVVDFEY